MVGVRRLYELRARLAIHVGKPSIADEIRQRGSEGCQHQFSTGAAGEFRPVTVNPVGDLRRIPPLSSFRSCHRDPAITNITLLAMPRTLDMPFS